MRCVLLVCVCLFALGCGGSEPTDMVCADVCPVDAAEVSVDCGVAGSEVMGNGTTVTYWDAWAPFEEGMSATVCTGESCQPAEVHHSSGYGRVFCGKSYERGGQSLGEAAEFVVFSYGDSGQ